MLSCFWAEAKLLLCADNIGVLLSLPNLLKNKTGLGGELLQGICKLPIVLVAILHTHCLDWMALWFRMAQWFD